MNRQSHAPIFRLLLGVSLFAPAACKDPTHPNLDPIPVTVEEICEASADWLPNTPEVEQFLPPPHPAGECPFYRSGWQNFLRAMQPTNADGLPALVTSAYATIDQVFQHAKQHAATRAYLGDIKQAGGRQILIDQNGNTLYYGIQVNQAFADFIHKYQLQTGDALRQYQTKYPNLTFPAGLVEFKDAWQVVEGSPDEIAAQTDGYVSMQTTVPTLSQDANGAIHEDRDNPRPVTVRLLAIHVVSTLVGHPEFVWASLEHSSGKPDVKAADLHRDVAPILTDDKNPDPIKDPLNLMNTSSVDDGTHYLLYRTGTAANQGNKAFAEKDLRLDPIKQKFIGANGIPQQTSIYRMFPASKSNTVDPDDAITSLNHNVEALFAQTTLPANDKRGHYRLLGAQWMDKPGYYDINIPIQNDPTTSPIVLGPHISQQGEMVAAVPKDVFAADIKENGSDSEFSILAGEDRMSSTAMESFTQAPGNFNNCFTCHNTQAITANGIPLGRDTGANPIKLLDPGLLNVSHVLSQFLLEEYEDSLTP